MKQPVKFTPLNAAANLIVAGAIVIAGAVLMNSRVAVGHWITVAGIGYYLLFNIRSAWNGIRRFSTLEPRAKAHTLIAVVMLFLFIRSIFIIGIPYFIILVLLAIEYLLLEPVKDK